MASSDDEPEALDVVRHIRAFYAQYPRNPRSETTQIDHMVAGLEFKPVNQIASPTTKTGPPKPRHQSVIDSRVLVVEAFNLFIG